MRTFCRVITFSVTELDSGAGNETAIRPGSRDRSKSHIQGDIRYMHTVQTNRTIKPPRTHDPVGLY